MNICKNKISKRKKKQYPKYLPPKNNRTYKIYETTKAKGNNKAKICASIKPQKDKSTKNLSKQNT